MDNIIIDRAPFEQMLKAYMSNVQEGLESEKIVDGVMYLNGRKGSYSPAKISKENGRPWNRDIFFICNGNDIIQKLWDMEIIRHEPNEKLPLEYLVETNDLSGIFKQEVLGRDGAIIYDRDTRRYTNGMINADHPSLEKCISKHYALPEDFVSEDCSIPLLDKKGFDNVGSKSETALRISRGFNDGSEEYRRLMACFIKKSAYNSTGMGVAVFMDDKEMGLVYTKYAPNSSGPFLSKEYKMVLMYKPYEFVNEKFVPKDNARLVYMNNEDRLSYSDGTSVFLSAKPCNLAKYL
jgi:hypothetical protein